MTTGAGDGDYPRLLYRPGSTMRVWNAHNVDLLTVHDRIEEDAAAADGWHRRPDQHPLDHDGDGRLGGSLPDAPKRRGRPRKVKGDDATQ